MKDITYTAASEIILPPGSTGADLQAAIDNAASGDTIVISGDMPFTDAVTLPAGKEIILQSDAGNNWVMTQPHTNTRHFIVAGTLMLRDITLDGMHGGAVDGGGGIQVNDGNLITHEGVVIQNCVAGGNGGAVSLSNGDFTMTGGLISNNTTDSHGGGVSMSNATFVMNGGEISHNTAGPGGGGIYVSGTSELIIYEGTLSDNAANYGGGIYMNDSTAAMDAALINGNTAIYGGGVYVRLSTYENLSTSVNTVFSCNRANTAYEPPADAGTLYPNIQFASTTIASHPLNNYDIGYMTGTVIDAAFHITYDANGGSGGHTGPGIEPCDKDTALPPAETGISRYGYTFTSWNALPDGSGTSYAPADEIVVSRDITLYAQWEADLFTVTYDANGGNGGYTSQAAFDSLYTVLPLKETGISRMMHSLTGWNTQPDGGGTPFAAGDTFIISGDITLYAQWKEITRYDAINLILISIAMGELAIACIVNAEGENLQYILGTQEGNDPGEISLCDILAVNEHIQEILKGVIKSEMLLQLKMDYAVKLHKS